MDRLGLAEEVGYMRRSRPLPSKVAMMDSTTALILVNGEWEGQCSLCEGW